MLFAGPNALSSNMHGVSINDLMSLLSSLNDRSSPPCLSSKHNETESGLWVGSGIFLERECMPYLAPLVANGVLLVAERQVHIVRVPSQPVSEPQKSASVVQMDLLYLG